MKFDQWNGFEKGCIILLIIFFYYVIILSVKNDNNIYNLKEVNYEI